MAVRTVQEVATAWKNAGGPASRVVEWVAIAMGESSLDDSVVSPAGAIGVWQIMPFNASIGGGGVSDLYNINYNAKVAVLMSGGGTNCAAWDSCYANISRSGRYSFLAYPEKGSADFNNIAVAGVALGLDATMTALPEPALEIGAAIDNSISGVQQAINLVLPQLRTNTLTNSRTVSAMYQPGWRAWASSLR